MKRYKHFRYGTIIYEFYNRNLILDLYVAHNVLVRLSSNTLFLIANDIVNETFILQNDTVLKIK